LVMDSLESKPICDLDQKLLKEYVLEFRTKMNAYLGIVV